MREGPYQPQANPRLCQVYQKTILSPSPGCCYLLHGEVCSVLLKVDLCDEGGGIDCARVKC